MLDENGYRPNVGIILVNCHHQVFWGKRLHECAWQFPQGGIQEGETPQQAMYRELEEELGLQAKHIQLLGRTQQWMHYDVPDTYIRREARGRYKGQKQIWFLLRMLGQNRDICLRASQQPEFDAWRWSNYWVDLEQVIPFKRGVYQQALQELESLLCLLPPPGVAPRRARRA